MKLKLFIQDTETNECMKHTLIVYDMGIKIVDLKAYCILCFKQKLDLQCIKNQIEFYRIENEDESLTEDMKLLDIMNQNQRDRKEYEMICKVCIRDQDESSLYQDKDGDVVNSD